MKPLLKRIAALTLCGLLAVPAVPAAGYESSEEIAFSLRPMETESGSYLIDGNTVYLTDEQAEAGISVRLGMYIEADYPDILCLSAKIVSDSANLTFNSESYQNPTAPYSDEPITYTLSDGTTFSTKLKPYCFGSIGSSGTYLTNSFGVFTNFKTDENAVITFVNNTSTMPFLGSTSDEFSYIEFDVDVAPGTQPGVYTISFVHDAEGEDLGHTYVSSDNGSGGYTDTFPTLKGASIVVSESQYLMTQPTQHQFLYAEDTTPIRTEHFFDEDARIAVAGENGYAYETLDVSAVSVTASGGLSNEELNQVDSIGKVLTAEDSELLSPKEYMALHNEQLTSNPDDALLADQPFTLLCRLEYEGQPLCSADGNPVIAAAYIGHRGDANQDGTTDATDAAKILRYAASEGSGKTASLTGWGDQYTAEKLAYFLADVNGSSTSCGEKDASPLDATDASLILAYAAAAGTGTIPDWSEILG